MNYPTDLGGNYQFTVGQKTEWDIDTDTEVTVYVAELPHQCDAWEISRNRDPAVVIADLARFITEAQAALDHLRRETA